MVWAVTTLDLASQLGDQKIQVAFNQDVVIFKTLLCNNDNNLKNQMIVLEWNKGKKYVSFLELLFVLVR